MCGIVAIKWSKLPPSSSLIDKAIEMLSERGKDAWGIAIGNNSGKIIPLMVKGSSNIALNRNKRFICKQIQNSSKDGWLLLHSRLATSGFSGLSEHNHPIVKSNVLLVHNGLVVEWPHEVGHLINVSNTDTQNLAVILQATDSINLEALLNKVVGEISIVWLNGFKNTINFYTNVGGLYLDKEDSQIIISSEPIFVEPRSIRVDIGKIVEL
jgi:glutamine phosphoribosylpyrophosphate amidotransferase